MRNAPSVLIPVGRSRFGLYAAAGAWLSGVFVFAVWRAQVPDRDAWSGLSTPQAVMAALLVGCAAFAWVSHRRTATGLLDWNGEAWCWTTARGDCEARVDIACDLQRWLLVRLDPVDDSGVQWLWLAPWGGQEHWRAARRALYFHGGAQAWPRRPAASPTVPP